MTRVRSSSRSNARATTSSRDATPMPDDERALFAIIGDEDTVSGFLLAGVGDVDERQRVNYFIVNEKTTEVEIAERFKELTAREDVAVLLITQIVRARSRVISANKGKPPSIGRRSGRVWAKGEQTSWD